MTDFASWSGCPSEVSPGTSDLDKYIRPAQGVKGYPGDPLCRVLRTPAVCVVCRSPEANFLAYPTSTQLLFINLLTSPLADWPPRIQCPGHGHVHWLPALAGTTDGQPPRAVPAPPPRPSPASVACSSRRFRVSPWSCPVPTGPRPSRARETRLPGRALYAAADPASSP